MLSLSWTILYGVGAKYDALFLRKAKGRRQDDGVPSGGAGEGGRDPAGSLGWMVRIGRLDVCAQVSLDVGAGQHLSGLAACAPVGHNQAVLGVLNPMDGMGPNHDLVPEPVAVDHHHQRALVFQRLTRPGLVRSDANRGS